MQMKARKIKGVFEIAYKTFSDERGFMAKLFDDFDALLTPAARGTAPEGIGSTGDPVMNGPWTLADFPTMTLPCALGSNGLPLGVQFSAPPFQERSLLELGKIVEAVVGFNSKPSITAA